MTKRVSLLIRGVIRGHRWGGVICSDLFCKCVIKSDDRKQMIVTRNGGAGAVLISMYVPPDFQVSRAQAVQITSFISVTVTDIKITP